MSYDHLSKDEIRRRLMEAIDCDDDANMQAYGWALGKRIDDELQAWESKISSDAR